MSLVHFVISFFFFYKSIGCIYILQQIIEVCESVVHNYGGYIARQKDVL